MKDEKKRKMKRLTLEQIKELMPNEKIELTKNITMAKLLDMYGIKYEKDMYNNRALNITNAYGDTLQIWFGGGTWILGGLVFTEYKLGIIEELIDSKNGSTTAIEYKK